MHAPGTSEPRMEASHPCDTIAPVTDDAILAGLDPEQRAVAEALDGPVVVLAGAGSGKTRAITHRIAHGVATGRHEARRTLAVTFTTRAAGEMRLRLRDLGVEGAQVRTFHSAALRQLRYFWPRLSGGEFPELLPSKARLVAEAASRCSVPTDMATVRDLSGDVEWAKVNFLSGEEIGKRAAEVRRTLAVPPPAMAAVLDAYEQAKSARGLLDFEDVLLNTAAALDRRPDIADEIRSAYRWFTVDEFQDVNPLQRYLLRMWLGDRDDVCVVGDANQTIYTFTGATPSYLTNFRRDFPDATEVKLERCYRCTPEIVQWANGIMVDGSPSSLTLVSQRPAGPSPVIQEWSDDLEEAAQIAAAVKAHIAEGVPARDIAVLFRVNAQSEVLEEAFAEAGIPVMLRGTERFFERPEVREAVTRLRGAARAGEVSGPLGEEVRAVLSAAGWTPEPPRTAGAVRERWESLTALVSLADDLGPGLEESLPAFITELDARAAAQHAPVADGVTLATIHAAKGLEWPIVFVIGCSEGLMPLSYAESDDQIEEERRLLYVAVTRAADRLTLSWARSRHAGGRASRSLSRFLQDLRVGDVPVAGRAGIAHRGSGRRRTERKQKAPARCRVCRKGLVTAPERTLGRCSSCPSDVDEGLLESLRAWRLNLSREKSVPAYVVFTDVTLIAIAEQRPQDLDALAEIPGVGPKKLAEHGDAVIGLVLERA